MRRSILFISARSASIGIAYRYDTDEKINVVLSPGKHIML
jgi:hypothetical protein